MPLILLGLLVAFGIVIYALVMYGRSDDIEEDTRPVRERYSHVFDKIRQAAESAVSQDEYEEYEEEDNEETGKGSVSDDGHTMYFPDDAEVEKRKRNIH